MDEKRVIESLTQGKEYAKQLQIHLNDPNSSSHQTQQILINNILNSYDKSLSLLTTPNAIGTQSHLHAGIGITKLESQVFSTQDSDHEFKDLQDHKDFSAKRNPSSMEKWKNEVKVRADMEVEEGLDDGYSWSKYGQKDILGAKHPRGYYRCTYRHSEGCLATKQVQRTEDDPNIFNISYRGSHTCNLGTNTTSTIPLPLPSPPQSIIQHLQQENQQAPRCPEFLLDLQTCDKPTTENIKTSSFQFPSTSNNSIIFPTLDNAFDSNTSPSFISPTTSVPAYFTMSQPRVSVVRNISSPVAAKSEVNNVVSVATSSTSSHNVDVGFQFGQMEFGNDFSFDNSIFFD
ncbi:probable WRKY transcription factor 30 [Cynara cardunculus var. scolymus]|uniref:DNA-binding WRKY n=1 Tax=Cynara cardunculus var. scolymus TaxID=59895 RepID=A0A103Y8T2_CYNCS|nr:probable WRKY transcription factor 30 [Cynara cardunculus var. scolymus]KVI04625.1 DNA-binding WRKY [Cynara cardunculus var. scolymus]